MGDNFLFNSLGWHLKIGKINCGPVIKIIPSMSPIRIIKIIIGVLIVHDTIIRPPNPELDLPWIFCNEIITH